MSYNSPGTSGIMNQSGGLLSGNHSFTSTNKLTSNRRFSSSTPTSVLLTRNRQYQGLSTLSTPYDFQAINPTLTKNINLTNNNEDNDDVEGEGEEDVIQINDDEDDDIAMNVVVTAQKSSPTDVRGRRNIHENCGRAMLMVQNINDAVGKRRRLSRSEEKQTRQNLNVPVVTSSNFGGGNHLTNSRGRLSSSSTYRTASIAHQHDSFVERGSRETIEEEEDELGGQGKYLQRLF